MNLEDFVKKAKEKHGNKYDYSESVYVNSYTKIIIRCKKHGFFEQFSNNHYRYGCKKCCYESNTNHRNKILKQKCAENFVEKAKKVHGYKYDYSESVYVNAHSKLKVICKEHGEFLITPNNHLRKKGCPSCGRKKSQKSKFKYFEEYLPIFLKVHEDKYDYSKVQWRGGSRYIKVICKKHGEFNVIPYAHIKGKGCQKCSAQYSKISIQWLNYMAIKHKNSIQHAETQGEYRIPNTRYLVDGYCKDTNTIYEYHGDFWHGNPNLYNPSDTNPRNGDTYGELYQKTINKKNMIIKKGFNYVEIWENDWKKHIEAVKKIQKFIRRIFSCNPQC